MAQPLYVNGAICTYSTATGTLAPTTGLANRWQGTILGITTDSHCYAKRVGFVSRHSVHEAYTACVRRSILRQYFWTYDGFLYLC